jgi:hypothetical protein
MSALSPQRFVNPAPIVAGGRLWVLGLGVAFLAAGCRGDTPSTTDERISALTESPENVETPTKASGAEESVAEETGDSAVAGPPSRLAGVAPEEPRKSSSIVEPRRVELDFDDESVDTLPPWAHPAETTGKGKPASWRVLHDASAPSPPHAFGSNDNPNDGSIHNLAFVRGSEIADVDVFLQVKALEGTENQGGGPVWRALDADNYYAARWNPLIDDIRVYRVRDGRRHEIGSARVEAEHEVWHEIRLVMVGDEIALWFDGKITLSLRDATHGEAGMVGMWMDGDARTIFDGFSARATDAIPK